MHRLTACYPRQRLLEEYPRRVQPRLHPELLLPPPTPPEHLWPDRRRKRSRPEVRRVARPAPIAALVDTATSSSSVLFSKSEPRRRRQPVLARRAVVLDRIAPLVAT